MPLPGLAENILGLTAVNFFVYTSLIISLLRGRNENHSYHTRATHIVILRYWDGTQYVTAGSVKACKHYKRRIAVLMAGGGAKIS